MSGVQTDCKVYVNVRAAFLPDGKMLPEELTWEDGTPYTIDRILNVKPSVAKAENEQLLQKCSILQKEVDTLKKRLDRKEIALLKKL